MSKNFQTTQYEVPVGEDGKFEFSFEDDNYNVGIKRLHVEEDPAKMEHVGGDISSSDYTLVDYNRAGTPLIEVVTKPDFSSPREAREYLQQLAKMLEYLGVYDPDSEYAIKSDANISIDGGNRVEVKNITGTKEVEKALNYEISRQKQLGKSGGEVEQETRNFNSDMGTTTSMRKKEHEEDYGYIFETDLTRQVLDEEFREKLKAEIPELPREKFERFKQEYELSDKLIESLISNQRMAADFEVLADHFDAKLVASWMTGELKKTLNYNELSYGESRVRKQWLKYLFKLLEDNMITDRNAELVLRELVEDPRNPQNIVEEKDLLKADEDGVDQAVNEALEENEDAVEDYREGDDEAINFLVGQVMQRSGGKADPKQAREKIIQTIEE
jgi:aspartyl-tRNA(Asn)/glutamyl-tRNA(Gln) amidotransferase subunit B